MSTLKTIKEILSSMLNYTDWKDGEVIKFTIKFYYIEIHIHEDCIHYIITERCPVRGDKLSTHHFYEER